MPLFESHVTLPADAASVFAFIIKSSHLPQISPPQVGLALVSAPEIFTEGCRFTFKMQGYGLVQQMEHEVSQIVPGQGYQETQIRGPLQSMVHKHILVPQPDGSTILTNHIEFQPPAGLLGLMVNADRILDSLEDAFDYRHAALKKVFAQ
jgi:ligand-binding SRPBCC domain-containing protein